MPGHSGRDFHLRLHPQPGGQLLLWSRLRLEEHRCGLDYAPASDHRHLAGLWPDPAGAVARGAHLHGREALLSIQTSTPTEPRTTSWSTSRLPATSAPEPGTGTRAAASPTTHIAIFPILFPPPAACLFTTAYVTASADSVTSNPVKVFVHAQVSSVALVGPAAMHSPKRKRPHSMPRPATASNGQQYLMCAPSSVTTAPSPNLACPRASWPDVGLHSQLHFVDRLFQLSLWATPPSRPSTPTPTRSPPIRPAQRPSTLLSPAPVPRLVTSQPARRNRSALRWPTEPPREPSPRACSRTSPPRFLIPTTMRHHRA